MDNWTKGTLIFLSLQLFVMGLLVSHLAYKLGYERGQLAGLGLDYNLGTPPEAGYTIDANHHIHRAH